jgi:hypothetical protein
MRPSFRADRKDIIHSMRIAGRIKSISQSLPRMQYDRFREHVHRLEPAQTVCSVDNSTSSHYNSIRIKALDTRLHEGALIVTITVKDPIVEG